MSCWKRSARRFMVAPSLPRNPGARRAAQGLAVDLPQALEQLELLRAQGDGAALEPHLVAREIRLEHPGPQGLILGVRDRLGPAQDGLDAGEDLPDAERLDHVVVGSEL